MKLLNTIKIIKSIGGITKHTIMYVRKLIHVYNIIEDVNFSGLNIVNYK